MANYIGFGRTNYFAVLDAAAFAAFCERWELEPFDKDGLVGFLADNDHGMPSPDYDLFDDEGRDPEEADWTADLAPMLADGAICIFMHAGREGKRYVGGLSLEITNAGVVDTIDLTQIYDSRPETEVSRAVY